MTFIIIQSKSKIKVFNKKVLVVNLHQSSVHKL